METSELLLNVLTMALVRLPVLIALTIGVVWVLGVPRGPVRSGALSGLLLLGAASLGGMFAGMLPMLLVNMGHYDTVAGMTSIFTAVHLALAVLEAFGLVLVVWALTRALRGGVPRPA